jgi:UDP-N-acetylmuramoyl-tripeptide--D-alanyl-D-alanine ligase
VSAAQVPQNRAPFSLEEVLQATRGKLLRPDVSTHIVGVCTDTRALQPGNLFVALKGERFDAHQKLNEAAQAGAVAAIVEHEGDAPANFPLIKVENTLLALGDLARFHRQRFQIPVVGITGSYGKTTTRALLENALRPAKRVLASRENFNNEIGVPQTLFGLDKSHQVAVIEMGMRGLKQIEYLADVAQPTIGAITNIGPQHIELLGSLENIAKAKGELIEALPETGLAVLPRDDQFFDYLKSLAKCRIVTFGAHEDSDYRVLSTRNIGDAVEFEFKVQSSKFKVLLPIPGAHNAVNAACALAIAGELGVPIEDSIRELAQFQAPGARMRVLESGGITIIDDCYNAGPGSTKASLEVLRGFETNGRRVAVLGAMKELGEYSQSEHQKIGAQAGFVDVLIGVGEETRAMLDAADVEKLFFATASEAVNEIQNIVRTGDVVLVKGSRSVGLEIVVDALKAGGR